MSVYTEEEAERRAVEDDDMYVILVLVFVLVLAPVPSRGLYSVY